MAKVVFDRPFHVRGVISRQESAIKFLLSIDPPEAGQPGATPAARATPARPG
jgi:hypothetical protein